MDDEELRWRDLRSWQKITLIGAVVLVIALGAAYRVFVLERGGWTDVAAVTGVLLGFVLVRVLWLTIRRRW